MSIKKQVKKYSAKEKSKIVLETLKEDKTIAEIDSENNIHPRNIQNWRKQFLENIEVVFDREQIVKQYKETLIAEASKTDELHRQIGELTAQLNWAKKNLKKLNSSIKRKLIDVEEKELSIKAQCEQMSICRQSYYYAPRPAYSEEDIKILHRMDELYTKWPFLGYRRQYLKLIEEHFSIGKERVRKYMRILDLEAFYSKKKTTTIANKMHKIYPYLLRNMKITRPNQVWAADITYIRLEGGFCYLIVVIDWFSRYILSWQLSNSLDITFCQSALEGIKTLSRSRDIQHRSRESIY